MNNMMQLHKSGKVEESLQLALRIAKSNPDDWLLLSRVALFIIGNNHFHLFGEFEIRVDEHESSNHPTI